MKMIKQGSKLSLSQRNMREECHLSKLNTQKGNSKKKVEQAKAKAKLKDVLINEKLAVQIVQPKA
jgi:hypothetical protein